MDPGTSALSLDEKRTLLTEILKQRALQPIRASLSTGQERLWRLLELEPESPVYNLGFAYTLRGPLDVAALEGALRALAQRHEALRTAFAMIDGVPTQVIASEAGIRFDRVDLGAIAAGDFPSEARRLAGEAARSPIDLTRAPLWRFILLERSDSDRVLLINTHHIISDRWSVGLLIQELAVEYTALVRGELSSARAPADSYREATRRIKASITDEEAAEQLAYWTTLLAGEVRGLILPAGPRPVVEPSYRGMRRTFDLPVEVASKLKSAAADEGTTVFVVLISALAAHMHCRTGQTDLIFTTPVSGRHHAATRGVIGYFNNLLPIRLFIAPRSDFREVVRAAAAAVKGAFDHQDVPFQQIAALPGLNRTRLARCFVAVQNTTPLDLVLPGIESCYEDVPTDTANFDLAIVLEEQGSSYRGWVDAKADAWSPVALDRFLGEFLADLEPLTDAPGRPLADSPHATPPEPDRLRDHGDHPGPDAQRSGPVDCIRNELERRIIGIWEDVMGLKSLAPDSHFFELGGHSLLAARIFDRIGATIGREVPLAALLRAPTIRQLSELILREGDAPCWAALVPVQPKGDRPPLFCVHGGGGGVLSYTRIAWHIGLDRPLWGLQAPKREGSAAPPRVEEMASHYIQAMLSVQPDGPYHILGHSFGGLVAFEIARQLAAQGKTMALLVIVDYPGPDARITWLDKVRWYSYALAQLDRRQRVPYIVDRLRYRIRKNPLLYRLLTRGGGLLGIEVDRRKTEYRLKTMSETMTAMELYRPAPYPGRLTLFRACGGDAAINTDRLGGWGRTALGGVEVHDFTCDHMDMFNEPHFHTVGTVLLDCLNRADRDPEAVIAPGRPVNTTAVSST